MGEPCETKSVGSDLFMNRLQHCTGTEQFIPSATGVARAEFLALGLTDAVLLELSSVEVDDRPTLMTVDLDLAIAAEMRGYRVMNFNHYR